MRVKLSDGCGCTKRRSLILPFADMAAATGVPVERIKRIAELLPKRANYELRECPQCSRLFFTERGAHVHMSKAHDVSVTKSRGTWAETRIVEYLKSRGWPYVERRALAGSRDRGDIAGIVNVVIEVKHVQKVELSMWVNEVRAEAANDGPNSLGFAWIKRKGSTDPGSWFVVTDGATFTKLLKEAGY